MTITILVDNLVSMHKGITPDEGTLVYNEIIRLFKQNKDVVLDFSGIELMTTAFLNMAIGELYKDHTTEDLKNKLSFANITEPSAIRIKKVTDNAKLFYKDQEKFNQSVNEVIHGNN